MKLLVPAAGLALAIWSGIAEAGADMHIDFPGKLLVPRAELLNSNLMTFTGSRGGISAPAITQSSDTSRQYEVGGNTFNTFRDAWNRSCDNQKNLCADFANSDTGRGEGVKVSDCDEQRNNCAKAVETATATAFASLTTSDAEFDYFCES